MGRFKIVPTREPTWHGKPVPQEFVRFCRWFHQDIDVMFASLNEAIVWAVEVTSVEDRPKLVTYLEKLLGGKYDNADLKGLWNRLTPGPSFRGDGARRLLVVALKELKKLEKS